MFPRLKKYYVYVLHTYSFSSFYLIHVVSSTHAYMSSNATSIPRKSERVSNTGDVLYIGIELMYTSIYSTLCLTVSGSWIYFSKPLRLLCVCV